MAGNGVGIAIAQTGSTGLVIDHNDATQNHNDGIAAYDGSASNTISYNKATDNVPVDCYDETVGAGTAERRTSGSRTWARPRAGRASAGGRRR